MSADDLDSIRTVLRRSASTPTRWHERQPLVIQACEDAMVEVVKAGFTGFVDTLDDGRIVFAVVTPNRGRPCLLFGPTETSHQMADVAYGSTIGIAGSHRNYEFRSGPEVQVELPIEELDRAAVLQAIAEFLANEVIT
jgi:hypothetical protein